MVESAKYHSPGEYLDAARSSGTTAEELAKLAVSEYNFVRLAVVKNKNVTAAMLRSALPANLDSWNSREIASNIASNPKTPKQTFRLIAERLVPYLNHRRDTSNAHEAAISLSCNPAVPLETVRVMLDSDIVAIGVRKRIATHSTRIDVLEYLLSDKSEAVRRSAANSIRRLR